METYFPHLTSTGPAPTCSEILDTYRQAFAQQLSDGTRRPLVFPDHFWSVFLLVLYLCIPHKDHPKIYAARWPLLCLITWREWHLIWETSGVGVALGYAAALMSAYVIVWSWTWLVFMRPQWDAKRVQRVKIGSTTNQNIKIGDTKNPNLNGRLRQRKLDNVSSEVNKSNDDKNEIDTGTYQYYWQSYPDNLNERIPWVIDLLFNMKGPGWNWCISTIPSLPPDILKKLGDPVPERAYSNISFVGNKRFNTRQELIIYHLSRYFFSYITLDLLKFIMMKDPYFKFGPTTYELPTYLQSFSSYLLRFYRLILAAIGVEAAVIISHAQSSIFMSCICGPRFFGLRAEPWYYSSVWGDFSTILRKGLGGFWGEFWHQTFRFFFTAPLNFLIRKGYIKSGSSTAKLMSLVFAFGISGFLHWAGSISIIAETYPSHLFIFFILQGIGIAIQRQFCDIFSPIIKKLPRYIRYTGNLIFTTLWLFYTGWIGADDFARGGLWLQEPLPFSILQYFGFREPGAKWFYGENLGFQWYTGKKWWHSGFIVI